jgi:hypothetical protein
MPTPKWKKGFCPNPKGRPKVDPQTKGFRELNNAEVTLAIRKYYGQPLAKLQEEFKNSETPAGDLMIISVMISAIKHGDYKRLDSLLDRACGRPKQVIEHQGGQTLKIEEERRRTAFLAMLKADDTSAQALEVLAKIDEAAIEADDETTDPR